MAPYLAEFDARTARAFEAVHKHGGDLPPLSNVSQIRLLEFLAHVTEATITVADVQRITGLSQSRAHAILQPLALAGVFRTDSTIMPHRYHYERIKA